MSIQYITLEREYGSGGPEIAALTAQACGIPCYGREIMEQVAREQHTSVEELERYEENVSGSFAYSFFVMSQSQTGDPDLLSEEAKLYVAESRVIRALAEGGPAIFVGHCASHVLRDRPGVLRVFIRAAKPDKKRRIMETYGLSLQEVPAACRRIDKRRGDYYALCTRRKWKDPANYDLVLDSSKLGTDGCAAVLTALYQKQ